MRVHPEIIAFTPEFPFLMEIRLQMTPACQDESKIPVEQEMGIDKFLSELMPTKAGWKSAHA
jgi:hypothetical protein